jgi:hypothetical protein
MVKFVNEQSEIVNQFSNLSRYSRNLSRPGVQVLYYVYASTGIQYSVCILHTCTVINYAGSGY